MMFLNSQQDLWKRWLACQRVTFVPMVASIVGNLISIPLIYIFIYILELGLAGIPIAQGLNSFIIFGTTVIYTFCKPETSQVL